MIGPMFARAASLVLFAASAAAQDKVDFKTQIQPIFAARCYDCHGPDEQEGDLRLDRKDAVFHGKQERWVIRPGQPAKSLLVERIKLPKDDPDVMPADGDPLTAEQIAVIERWIAEGAHWPDEGAAPVPRTAEDPVQITLDPAARKAVDEAVAALQARGAVVGPIARDHVALDVNLALLRPPAGDAEVELLRGLAPALVWLDLSRTAVTDAGLAPLAACTQLRRLHLAQTGIGDAGLRALRDLRELRFLNLFGTKVTDAGLTELHGLTKLERIFLWQTAVTDAGVAALQQALPKLVIDRGGHAQEVLDVSRQLAEAEAKARAALPPGIANVTCPVAGKPIDAAVTLAYEGRTIAFCCRDCRAKFEAEPAKFTPNLPKAKADK